MDNINKTNGVNNKSSKAADKSAEDQLVQLMQKQFNEKLIKGNNAKSENSENKKLPDQVKKLASNDRKSISQTAKFQMDDDVLTNNGTVISNLNLGG